MLPPNGRRPAVAGWKIRSESNRSDHALGGLHAEIEAEPLRQGAEFGLQVLNELRLEVIEHPMNALLDAGRRAGRVDVACEFEVQLDGAAGREHAQVVEYIGNE